MVDGGLSPKPSFNLPPLAKAIHCHQRTSRLPHGRFDNELLAMLELPRTVFFLRIAFSPPKFFSAKPFLYGLMIFMFYTDINESVKTFLEPSIGIYVLEELFDVYDFDIIDCFDACRDFLPPNYMISRMNYLFSSY